MKTKTDHTDPMFLRGNVWCGENDTDPGFLLLTDAQGRQLSVPASWCHLWGRATEVYPEIWPALRKLEAARDAGLGDEELARARAEAIGEGDRLNADPRKDMRGGWDSVYDDRDRARKAGYRR